MYSMITGRRQTGDTGVYESHNQFVLDILPHYERPITIDTFIVVVYHVIGILCTCSINMYAIDHSLCYQTSSHEINM